ncbi:monovalent cation/H+ antiporter complex subunit F [Actinotignum urinale]|uniref:monovalent cation/H+ antiporter complex subunit F n=1 Tax=Actinotignum urinale TaxID=190146 RepID=UPI0003B75D26|nr:monovalent cation/H+ antiporter complex subunit F [Actinotignum urinale]MDY5160634.1 monovalent cation/H+ antiporter complex subunit F [Actinotignum urinale]
MTYVIIFCSALLLISAFLVVVRIVKGPTVLDRTGALDVMTSIMMASIALLAAVTRRPDLLAVFVVVAVIGFLGSVAVARMTRIRTREDLAEDQQIKETGRKASDVDDEDKDFYHDTDTDDSEGVHDPDVDEDDSDDDTSGSDVTDNIDDGNSVPHPIGDEELSGHDESETLGDNVTSGDNETPQEKVDGKASVRKADKTVFASEDVPEQDVQKGEDAGLGVVEKKVKEGSRG